MKSETSAMPANKMQPRSMLLLRRAADAAGYAIAAAPEDEPRRTFHLLVPAVVSASIVSVLVAAIVLVF
ncbi:MAG: hypothetical protein K2Y29_15770 [Beijerinckiaceae bacterium]|nr:hypothetical protein [Beijerinckiaceae bacterium]